MDKGETLPTVETGGEWYTKYLDSKIKYTIYPSYVEATKEKHDLEI